KASAGKSGPSVDHCSDRRRDSGNGRNHQHSSPAVAESVYPVVVAMPLQSISQVETPRELSMRYIVLSLGLLVANTAALGVERASADGSTTTPWEIIEPYFTPPPEFENAFGDYRSPLRFADGTAVESADDWQ